MSLIPQLGFFEIMLLAVLALVVVGPNELPRLMRSVGKFMAQARHMAREFMAGFDQMAREAELDELQKEIEALKKQNPVTEIRDEVNKTMAPMKDLGSLDPEAKKSDAKSDGDAATAAGEKA
ncbi:MAG: Sec-independent protein translocase protein TatB [Aquisalinus sp.]|nr:Sec-independent protein translocase protein TatB [Aquisalinus sp.]